MKALVAPYHARVRAELERHGGTFEKFSGDAVLALFGTPKAHEDDPERAVRAGLAVRKAIADLNAEDEWLDLHIRVGIHTGEALIMLGARPSEGEWSAAGDVLNTAARIQSAAPTDGILVGEQTYLAAKDAFEFEEAEPVEAKGKAEPVQVWEVAGERDDARGRPRIDLPLIGRLEELEELSAFCDASPRGAARRRRDDPRLARASERAACCSRSCTGSRSVVTSTGAAASPTAMGSHTGRSRRSSRTPPESSTTTTRAETAAKLADAARGAGDDRPGRAALDRRGRLEPGGHRHDTPRQVLGG